MKREHENDKRFDIGAIDELKMSWQERDEEDVDNLKENESTRLRGEGLKKGKVFQGTSEECTTHAKKGGGKVVVEYVRACMCFISYSPRYMVSIFLSSFILIASSCSLSSSLGFAIYVILVVRSIP